RAFENGRIDLSQAEGAMLLIGAQGEAAARAALRQMDGAVSLRVRKAQDRLTAMLAEIAACTDFPDEIEEAPTARNLLREAVSLAADLRAACDARQGRVLAHGLDVVIAGKPNVGKSSLLNALLGETRAIVTSQPGTTRDTVHGSLSLSGVTVNLTDTAGLRAAEGEAEAMGVDRARRLMAAADLLLIVLDASAPVSTEDHQLLRDTKSAPRLVLLNKADLPFRGTGSLDSCHKESNKIPANPSALPHDLAISARTGEGIDALRARLGAAALGTRTGSALFTQARHADAAGRAAAHLEEMARALADGMPVDFAAVDAREALSALGEITGENVEESVVDAVFRDFCVGK
ncbi:MAG: GTP-binding protein, partial [Firmicutes bacterium]|nr:GTP-binding protein [Bacillota bacterium]